MEPVKLIPFVGEGRGAALTLMETPDGLFELAVAIHGHGTKSGGRITPQGLLTLGKDLQAAAIAKMTNDWASFQEVVIPARA